MSQDEEYEAGGTTDPDEEKEDPSRASLVEKDQAYMAYVKKANEEGFAKNTVKTLIKNLAMASLPFWRTVTHTMGDQYDTYTIEPGTSLFTGCVKSKTSSHVLSRGSWFTDENTAAEYSRDSVLSMKEKFFKLRDKNRQRYPADYIPVVRHFVVVNPIKVLAMDSCKTIEYVLKMSKTRNCGGIVGSSEKMEEYKQAYACSKYDLSKFKLSYPLHKFRTGIISEENLKKYEVPVRLSYRDVDERITTCMCGFPDVNGHAALGFPGLTLDGRIDPSRMFNPEVFLCNPGKFLIDVDTIDEWAR